MIHVAPCSCELHQALAEWKARAEKAEAQVEEMVLANRQWIKAGKEAQARVAELEKERHELRLAVFDTETLRVKEREAD